jgi:hypothetical protein
MFKGSSGVEMIEGPEMGRARVGNIDRGHNSPKSRAYIQSDSAAGTSVGS